MSSSPDTFVLYSCDKDGQPDCGAASCARPYKRGAGWKKRGNRGFTALEIMVVIFVGALLLAAAVAKLLDTMKNGKYQSICNLARDMETASTQYLAKPGGLGTLPITEGTIPSAQYTGTGATGANIAAAATIDQMLTAEGCLKKPIGLQLFGTTGPTGSVPVSWSTTSQKWTTNGSAPTMDYSGAIRCETTTSNSALTPDVAAGANFNLTGDGVTYLADNKVVEYLVIPNVPIQQARELSVYRDGESKSASGLHAPDTAGEVVYPSPTGGYTTVYMYILDL